MFPNSYPYYYPYYYYSYPWSGPAPLFRADTGSSIDGQPLIANLEKAVNGEHQAIQKYEKLIELAPNKQFRNIIASILNDEQHHFKVFSEIYANLTNGKKVTLTDAVLPKSFMFGVEESVPDELGDSKFYQDTSLLTTNENMRRIFLNASHDEQRHATWFMYILYKLTTGK